MASVPKIPYAEEQSPPVADRGSEVVRTAERPRARSHKDRFRASLAWALGEYASTLAKLAK